MLSHWIFTRSRNSWFGNGVVLVFLVVQALDGVLTYIGLATLGSHMEGNPLVAGLMAVVGTGPALTGAKLIAGSLGIALHLSGTHRLVAILTAVYVAVAIGPWTALLVG
jgi:hypothetical protein